MIHEFQLKWKTYLLLYYAIPSVQQFRSQKKGALCPLSRFQNSISIFLFLFFFRGMWHICISQLCLIRICWLKVNEINSSWWHWVRLPLCLSTRHTVDPLITCSQSHTFVSTNVHFCCLTVIRYFFFFSCQSTDARKSAPNYLSISGLPFLPWEHFCDWCRACGCLECTPLPPLPLHLSCRQWILIEGWLSDNLLWHCSGLPPALCWPPCLQDESHSVAIIAAKTAAGLMLF